jgi:hypothetical protein
MKNEGKENDLNCQQKSKKKINSIASNDLQILR